MLFITFLWILIWGGMFSGIYNIQSPRFLSDPFSIMQGVRSLFPILAFYLCLIWILAKRPKFPFLRNPLGFLMSYSLIGFLTSLFLSVDTTTSIYWVSIYLAPLLVFWAILAEESARGIVQKIIYINYAIFFFIAFSVFPEVVKVLLGRARLTSYNRLPFNLGLMTKNGTGRFALVVFVVAISRMSSQGKRFRFFWAASTLVSLIILAGTQSRTALLGLAICLVLYVLLQGINWRFLFLGPVITAIVWVSGVKWRAHGQWDMLLSLTGRQNTWQRGLEMIKHSPLLGWGFNADRLMLNLEHMHNSYLHAMIHTGIVGVLFFIAAIIGIWYLIFRHNLIFRARGAQGSDKPLLMESVMIIGFLTARSFFESTAAFYGVDLLLLIPAMAYVVLAARHESVPLEEPIAEVS
jgi:O-antigen ligase